MTNEDLKIEIEKEWKRAIDWANKESDKVSDSLKNEIQGLDVHREAYAYINEELNKKRIELQERYKQLCE